MIISIERVRIATAAASQSSGLLQFALASSIATSRTCHAESSSSWSGVFMAARLSSFVGLFHRENPYVFFLLADLHWRLNKTGVHMNITLLRHARQLFQTYDAPPAVIRSYQRKWARSVHQLGDKWLFAQPIVRVQ